MATHYDIAVMF